MNKAILLWNITQDVEMKQTTWWQKVIQVWFATNEKYTDRDWNKQEKTEFHNLVAWEKKAEFFEKFVKKWMKLLIEWKIQTQSWDWEDWKKRYKTSILVSSVEFCSKKSDSQWAPKNEEITAEDIPF